ncbi:hypothetical protein EV586_101334 [Tumebacillus sp. BK434]|uniref:hypothetical protein n=1 Tax=Tumebacillus sp. BK434 TaxID=2512169 RepID=UPI00104E9594|nr:hypothetical protein [Tumebacillus sp. BK434]TCP59118.1 hypothetical protein EV586_101334 [Tumebacillus sp. BK434]
MLGLDTLYFFLNELLFKPSTTYVFFYGHANDVLIILINIPLAQSDPILYMRLTMYFHSLLTSILVTLLTGIT